MRHCWITLLGFKDLIGRSVKGFITIGMFGLAIGSSFW